MEEDERSSCSSLEYTINLKRGLSDIFGSFDDFYSRVQNGKIRHGLIRSKLRGKASPLATLSNASPSQLPVQTLLNSMRNLAEEEPISNLTSLPTASFSKREKMYHHSSTPSSSSSIMNDSVNDREDYKRRKRKERNDEMNDSRNGDINGHSNNEQHNNSESDRRKRSRFDNNDGLSRSATPKPIDYDRGGGGNDSKLLKESLNRQHQQQNSNSIRKNAISSSSNGESMATSSTTRLEKDANNDATAAISPDSGVHSTENDLGEQSIDEMLQIMRSISGEKLSPLPKDFMSMLKEEEDKKKKRVEKEVVLQKEKKKKADFNKVFNDAESSASSASVSPASSSAASSPRMITPPPVLKKEEPTPIITIAPPKKNGILSGEIRLTSLKSEKIQKLLKLAKKNGCLVEEKENSEKHLMIEKEKEKDKEREKRRSKEKREKERQATNRKVQQLSASESSIHTAPQIVLKPTPSSGSTPATMSVNGGSSKNTPIASRPGSSMSSAVPRSQNATPKQERAESSNNIAKNITPPAGSSSVPTTSSWKCAWNHARLTTVQRVQIPDPTVPNPKTKTEFYHGLAKKFKSSADNAKDRVKRVLDYMVSSVYFIMESLARNDKENSPQSKMQCLSMYRETQDLLRVALTQFLRETNDHVVMHVMPRIKMIGQIMLAIMHYQMFTLRADQVNKYATRLDAKELTATIEKVENATTSDVLKTANAPSPWLTSMLTQNTTMVQVPQAVLGMFQQQAKNMSLLLYANNYWSDWKMLELKVDLEFIKNIETVCKNHVTLEMSFEALAPIVLTAVASLTAEYQEEKSATVKPPISKAKRQMDAALHTGGYYPPMPSRQLQKPPPPSQQQQSSKPPPPKMQ